MGRPYEDDALDAVQCSTIPIIGSSRIRVSAMAVSFEQSRAYLLDNKTSKAVTYENDRYLEVMLCLSFSVSGQYLLGLTSNPRAASLVRSMLA